MSTKMMKGALLFTLVAILSKVLSAVYRVPFQNMVGNEGFYIYQQVYPYYSFLFLLATVSVPTLLARDVVRGVNIERQQSTIVVYSVAAAVGLFSSAPLLAAWMGDLHLVPALRIISGLYLCLPIVAIGRGFFQGMEEMEQSAYSQLLDQLLRVVGILTVAALGLHWHASLYTIGQAAYGATLFASVSAACYMAWKLQRHPRFRFRWSWQLDHRFMYENVVVCAASLALVSLQFIDSLQLVRLLGGGRAAMEWKGIYDRAWPIVQVGFVVSTSFAFAFVPQLAKVDGFRHNVQFLLKLATFVSLAATVGLVAIMPHLNVMLFETSEGTGTLAIMALTVFSAAMLVVYVTVLQTVERTNSPLVAVALLLISKYVLNRLLVPEYGLNGAALSSALATGFAYSYVAFTFRRRLSVSLSWRQWRVLLWSVGTMGLVLWTAQLVASADRLWSAIMTPFLIGSGALIAMQWLGTKQLWTEEEWEQLPAVFKRLIWKKSRELQ